MAQGPTGEPGRGLIGARHFDYSGVHHVLGRTDDRYAIWTRSGGEPVRTFPLSDEGWTEAWQAYQALEEPVTPLPPSSWRRGSPIRLAPMQAGQVIGGAFRLYRMYFPTLLGVVAPVMLGFHAVVVYLNWVTARPVVIEGIRVFEVPEWVTIVTALGSAATTQFLTAALAKTALDAFAGSHVSVATAYRFAVRLVFPVGWALILLVLLISIVIFPGEVLRVLAVRNPDPGLQAAALLTRLAGAAGALFLYVRLLFSPLAVVLEGHRGGQALRRSWRLSRGVAGRIFGVLILALLILLAVVLLVSIPLLVPILSRGVEITRANLAVLNAVNGLLTTVFTPFFSVVTILLYADARLRKEEQDPERLWAAVP